MTNDGGPAFPGQPMRHYGDGAVAVTDQPGMSLRDYFAAKVMASLLLAGGQIGDEARYNTEMCALMAYRYADAMLAERSKVKP